MGTRPNLLRIASRVSVANNVPGREGQFAAPDGQVIAHLQKFLTAKVRMQSITFCTTR